jgi:hypothetical protein
MLGFKPPGYSKSKMDYFREEFERENKKAGQVLYKEALPGLWPEPERYRTNLSKE